MCKSAHDSVMKWLGLINLQTTDLFLELPGERSCLHLLEGINVVYLFVKRERRKKEKRGQTQSSWSYLSVSMRVNSSWSNNLPKTLSHKTLGLTVHHELWRTHLFKQKHHLVLIFSIVLLISALYEAANVYFLYFSVIFKTSVHRLL